MRKFDLVFVTASLAMVPVFSEPVAADDNVLDGPEARRAVERVRSWRNDTAKLLVDLGSIESPSGEEHARAARVAEEIRPHSELAVYLPVVGHASWRRVSGWRRNASGSRRN